MAIKILAGIAKDGTNEGARVSAAVALLDRGWGRPPQAHTGQDGEGALQVTIRHIVEGRDGKLIDSPADAKLIDAAPVEVAPNGTGER
jgi:hypothetical protein